MGLDFIPFYKLHHFLVLIVRDTVEVLIATLNVILLKNKLYYVLKSYIKNLYDDDTLPDDMSEFFRIRS